jgi:Zn-dependent metalloprotease
MVVRQRLGLPPLSDPACVADWDATSYDPTPPHCLRRVDSNLHDPEDLVGRVHADGRIWSRALWDIRNAIGHVRADTIILEGQFDFPGTTMTDLANRIVATAQRLYGNATANTVRAQFKARGILS